MLASQSYLLNTVYVKGFKPSIYKRTSFNVSERSSYLTKRPANRRSQILQCSAGTEFLTLQSAATSLTASFDSNAISDPLKQATTEITHALTLENFNFRLVLADLDPATAKLAIGFLGPFLSVFGFLFILRIVMSWYPKLPVGKFPYVIAYAPTEPLLVQTRKVIPPLAGVDVTPVVWFGLISFLNEILVGPQGLLVLLSQQVN
ncbi:protein COFACTOR ASSEMBLY OF COMPLEX C SUBUNIT B CCB3, chloroplastic-like [Prosopis cineraria]|uniref:protein COFACTOR ASSEMBLY OF COMPLEX C SUBUNIT B CCB3, chloroplastic-like n=1 Tax=Prosopis cineraria TaxID=364024 RepID=UPI00240F38EA|nr:protein COFACTOR ASSEMBLY OF COMPLEX C SUBUNIT B CCB3, chloroplastic-like [Prosopis cineraria]